METLIIIEYKKIGKIKGNWKMVERRVKNKSLYIILFGGVNGILAANI